MSIEAISARLTEEGIEHCVVIARTIRSVPLKFKSSSERARLRKEAKKYRLAHKAQLKLKAKKYRMKMKHKKPNPILSKRAKQVHKKYNY